MQRWCIEYESLGALRNSGCCPTLIKETCIITPYLEFSWGLKNHGCTTIKSYLSQSCRKVDASLGK